MCVNLLGGGHVSNVQAQWPGDYDHNVGIEQKIYSGQWAVCSSCMQPLEADKKSYGRMKCFIRL